MLSYLSKLQAGKEASQIDLSGFSLLAVPFEVPTFLFPHPLLRLYLMMCS